jgi:hypothetical protein
MQLVLQPLLLLKQDVYKIRCSQVLFTCRHSIAFSLYAVGYEIFELPIMIPLKKLYWNVKDYFPSRSYPFLLPISKTPKAITASQKE